MTPEELIATFAPERAEAIQAVRSVILANLAPGFSESVASGMINYCVPHSIYPAGYHCNPKQPLPFAALANTKTGMSLHLVCIYGDEARLEEFQTKYRATGKRLDMGKACVRFKKLEELPLDVIGETIASFTVEGYVKAFETALSEYKSARSKK